MRLSSWLSPFSMEAMKSSRLRRTRRLACMAARSRASRFSAIWRAMRSSSTTMKFWPAPGTADETQHHRGTRRVGLGDLVAVLVEHGAHTTVGRTGHDRVAHAQRSALDQHRGDRTATAVEVRLDHEALGVLVGVGAQVERRVGGEDDGLEQLVEVEPGLGRDVDEHRVAAVLLGDQAVLGELATDLGGVGLRLVDLVDRDHDRHVGRLGVVERLDRLRHDAVVGRDHQDRDVGGLGTTGTHGGERLVTRGVDEGDATVVAVDLGVDLVGTDVLGDATGLLVDHVGVAQRVEELGLSVVDVTHDGHDRRTDDQVGLVALVGTELEVERLEQLAVLVLGRDDLDDVVELLGEQLERLVADRLGRGDHLAEREQHLHEGSGVDVDALGEVGQRGATRETHGLAVALADAHATQGRGVHGLELLTTGALRLATTTRRATGATEGTLGLATLAGTTAAGTTATGRAEATGTTGSTAGGAGAGTTRSTATAGGTRTAGAATGAAAGTTAGRTTARTVAEGRRGLRHHRRVGARHAGTALAAGRRTGRTAVVATGARGGALAHALARGERVVARARGAGTADRARCGARGLRGRGSRCLGLGRRGLGLGGRRLRAGLRAGPGSRRRRLGGRGRGLGRRLGRGLGSRGGLSDLDDLGGLGGCRGRCGLGAGLGRGLLGGGLVGRRSLGGGCGRCGLQLVAVLLLEAHLDGRLDSRRCRLDELPHLLELLENELALDSELLGEFVDSGLCHDFSLLLVRDPRRRGETDQLVGVHTHHELLIECS